MSLARAWTRQLFGASGAALLVPGTVVVAIALLGLAGGFGQLGTLGQAFAGPALPTIGSAPPQDHGQRSAPPVVPGSHAAASPASVAVVTAGSAPAGSTVGGGPGGRSGGSQGGSGASNGNGGGGPSGRSGSGAHHVGSSPGQPAPAPTPTASPPPTSKPTLVDGVVNAGKSITEKVPGPVGTTATQLLQSLGRTVDGLLPLARSNSGASTSTSTSTSPSATDSASGATGP